MSMLARLRKFKAEHYIIADERPAYLGDAQGLVDDYEDLIDTLIFELEMWEDKPEEGEDHDAVPGRPVRPQSDERRREE